MNCICMDIILGFSPLNRQDQQRMKQKNSPCQISFSLLESSSKPFIFQGSQNLRINVLFLQSKPTCISSYASKNIQIVSYNLNDMFWDFENKNLNAYLMKILSSLLLVNFISVIVLHEHHN